MLGFTINRVSLFALIFSIGILVDDATVVVENVFRRWLADGEASLATAVDAVGEVGNPTIMATLTVVAALLPMGFVTGMMGPYMLPIPVLGSVAMLFSLIAAFVFTPWIAYRLRPRLSALERAGLREQRIQRLMGRVYRPIIVPLIERRWLSRLFLGAILVAFVQEAVDRGKGVRDAVVEAGLTRLRPIWVTDLTMMAGAFAIHFDPIFEGMAISLLFGPIIAVPLTLLAGP